MSSSPRPHAPSVGSHHQHRQLQVFKWWEARCEEKDARRKLKARNIFPVSLFVFINMSIIQRFFSESCVKRGVKMPGRVTQPFVR